MKFQSVHAEQQTQQQQTQQQQTQTHATQTELLTQAHSEQAHSEKGIVVVASSSSSAWAWTQHTTALSKIAFGFVVGSAVIFGGLVGWLIQWATNKRSKNNSEYGKAFIPKGDE